MRLSKSYLKLYSILGLLVVIITFIVSDIVIRSITKERIETIISSSLRALGDVYVDLSVFPAIKVISGQIDSLYISAENVVINELPMRRIEIDAQNVVWPVGLDKDEIISIENALADGKIKIVMNADDVNDGIISKLSGISNFKMSFEDGKVCMNGKTTILSLPFNLFTQGDISAGPNNTVKYSIESIRVEGFEITNVIGEIVRNLLNFNFKLPDLPFALTLDSIDIQNDTIVFNGTSNR